MSENNHGVIDHKSPYSVSETIDRLAAAFQSHGMQVFARIDQQAAAVNAGLTMRPMEMLIFGSPAAGTPLMVAHPSLAIDLPLKALAWEDTDGTVWVSYNSPAYLQQRHGLPSEPFGPAVSLIEATLAVESNHE